MPNLPSSDLGKKTKRLDQGLPSGRCWEIGQSLGAVQRSSPDFAQFLHKIDRRPTGNRQGTARAMLGLYSPLDFSKNRWALGQATNGSVAALICDQSFTACSTSPEIVG